MYYNNEFLTFNHADEWKKWDLRTSEYQNADFGP